MKASREIEIHDSTLVSMTLQDGSVVLHFSPVYIHESEGVPGVDAGSVWVQEAYLKIGNAAVVGSFSHLPCEMWRGHIRLDGALSDNMIPIPLNHQGPVELRLEGGGGVVSITGNSAKLELAGKATYVEEFTP
jgi:hypothetical protein